MSSLFTLFRQQVDRSLKRGTPIAISALVLLASGLGAQTRSLPWSQRTANSVVERWPEGRVVAANSKPASEHGLGILLRGMDAAWYESANGAYYQFTKQVVDQHMAADGSIVHDSSGAVTTDDLALGRQILFLYRVTQDSKYYKAAGILRRELAQRPEAESTFTPRGQREGSPISAERIYFADSFYAEYSSVFHESANFRDITSQFVATERQLRFLETGPAKDVKQPLSDRSVGRAHGEATNRLGWYMMALVDSLDFYPNDNPDRGTVLAILSRAANATIRQSNLWDKSNASAPEASCMLIYSLQKAVRKGYLPQLYAQFARRSWRGVINRYASRDFSDDPIEAGALLLAATEMEMGEGANHARGGTVLIDSWFNSQQRKNAAGQEEYFHYKWNDYSDSGFSLLGHVFASHGAELGTLYQAPTMASLKRADYYIIASPDIPVKNPHPHYVEPRDAAQVAEWVKGGGVLILMPNDPANGDIEHLDLLADQFGIHFNKTLAHHVIGDQFAPGRIPVSAAGVLFHTHHMLYMKDTCTISITAPAQALLTDEAGVVIATAKYGKGTVVAVVDPWLYNEYTDHRKTLPEQDNYTAGKEFVAWLMQQSHRTASQRQSNY